MTREVQTIHQLVRPKRLTFYISIMAKAKDTEFNILPQNTTIEAVAIMPDGVVYIFDLTISQWKRLKKKPGVVYYSFQKGFSSFKDAIRTEYKEQ